MQILPESTRLLYTQLLGQCLQAAAPSDRGLSFVRKSIKGADHWYLQITIGSRKTQHYLGPDTDATRELVAKEKAHWQQTAPDRQARERLVAMLTSGGALTVSHAEARVFELLERAGIFLAGGVLVGSHAFGIYANMLGVVWPTATTRTADIDLAGDQHIALGMPATDIDLKQILLDADMGFIEVPALDRKSPSTRFRIQGKELSVDLLTPLTGKPVTSPVPIPAFKAYAEPVRFLDYLLDDIQPAVIVTRGGILVNVPAPARYALHKLVTATRRQPAMHTKKQKDIEQATLLLTVLLEQRPGDIQVAMEAAQQMPTKFVEQLTTGIEQLPAELSQAIT